MGLKSHIRGHDSRLLLNGIILSLYHVRTVCEDFNSQAVFALESEMMGHSSAYAVERWLLYRQHQGFTVSNGEGPDAAFV